MRILDKNEIHQHLADFYKEKYGELDTDHWFQQPAVNPKWMKHIRKLL